MFSKKIRNLRENKGINQEKLGKMLGLSASTVGMYEQGRRQPDNETLIKIAEFFDVSTDYLLGITEVKNYNKPYAENIDKELFVKLSSLNKKEKEKMLKIIDIFFK